MIERRRDDDGGVDVVACVAWAAILLVIGLWLYALALGVTVVLERAGVA